MAGLRGGAAPVHAAPRHHDGIGRESFCPALQNLVPANEGAAVRFEPAAHLRRHPALQVVLVRQAQLADTRLRERARLPLILYGLVAAGMDPVTRKERQHFGQHVLHEMHGRVRRIEDVGVHAPVREDFELLAGVAEPRIRGDRGLRVPRHLDFRHDRDEARLGVRDDLADVVLRVESAVRNVIVDPLRRVRIRMLDADERLTAPGSHRREQRILLDVDAPSLIVGQMPVKTVQLMDGEEIDVFLDEFLGHERPRHVEVRAAPGEARPVFDRYRGHRPGNARAPDGRGAKDVRRQELAQRLDGVKRAGGMECADRDPRRRHGEAVAFLAEARERRIDAERDGSRAAPRPGGAHREPIAGCGL